MAQYTVAQLAEMLGVSIQAVSSALAKAPYELKRIDTSTKPVKHYDFEDLPQKYQEQINPTDTIDSNKSLNYSSEYLLSPLAKQQEAVLRARLVEYYKARASGVNVKSWLEATMANHLDFEPLGDVQEHTLYRWVNRYDDAKAKGGNVVEAMMDKRGAKKGATKLSEEMQQTAVRYFMKNSIIKIRNIYNNMAFVFGEAMPSYDTLNNFYKEWKRKNPQLLEFAHNPDSWKNKYQAAFGSISDKAKYRNHYWELDSTPADVICSDGKRYSVLAAIDVFTRRAVFLVAETSNSYNISRLLRKAILRLGIPENVVIDNGRDYRSNHFESICINLGINQEVVPPYSGDMKPHVERLFGTISRELFEQMGGFIGHNVADRSALNARKTFGSKIEAKRKHNEKLRANDEQAKEAWAEKWKISKENIGLDLEVTYSPTELENWIDKWAFNLYEKRAHGGIKTSPLAKWESSSVPVQGISDVRMLDLLLGESVTRKVGKKGINYDGALYQHLNLVEYIGSYVYLLVPSDYMQVLVYNEKMEFVCIAEDIEKEGLNRFDVRQAKQRSQALARKYDKLIKEIAATEDITILDRLEQIEGVESATPTIAITKRTEVVDLLLNSSEQIAAADQEALAESNRYDFKNKDENGKPTKVTPSGRPAFETYHDRFVWALVNDDWNEKDERLKEENKDVYEIAYKEYLRHRA